VARVDVHHREGELARSEGLLRQAQEHDRVLAAREEEHRPLELGRELAHDVNRLRLELVEVGEMDGSFDHDGGVGSTEPPKRAEVPALPAPARESVCSPHSVRPLSAQRPSRPAPGRVEWESPIEA
jgi:hypothetical protein